MDQANKSATVAQAKDEPAKQQTGVTSPVARGTVPTIATMKRRPSATGVKPAQARRYARQLTQRVQAVLALHPQADPDNVRHTLILLEQPPLERLQRSLIRARTAAILNQ